MKTWALLLPDENRKIKFGKFNFEENVGAKCPQPAGFEPAREDPIGLAVQRLNHSAKAALLRRRIRKLAFQSRFFSGGNDTGEIAKHCSTVHKNSV